jgi:hypothetical protein
MYVTIELKKYILFGSIENKGFPNGPGFRYGNFFIPRVVKNHFVLCDAQHFNEFIA